MQVAIHTHSGRFIVLLSILALTACITPANRTASPSGTPIASSIVTALPSATNMARQDPTVPPLVAAAPLDLALATSVSVIDDWDGLAAAAPYKRAFYWDRAHDGYHGTGTVSIGGYECEPHIREVRSTIPLDEMITIARIMMQAQLSSAPYQPMMSHTDDYPSKRIRFVFAADSVTFFSTSQGTDYLPWGYIYRGQTYTIVGNQPYQALKLFRSYMHQDVERELEIACAAERK